MDANVPAQSTNKEFKCTACGALLNFKPGTTALVCPYCNAANEIAASTETLVENDLVAMLEAGEKTAGTEDVTIVACESCGAQITVKPNVTSDQCPYCATNYVLKPQVIAKQIKPQGVLPFKIEVKDAFTRFQKWLGGLWFAPSDLKSYAGNTDRLAGIYVPYWTFDATTSSHYSGERGDAYYETESYTATENGQSVTRERQVRKVRWTHASGQVSNDFDDVLVLASETLPRAITQELEPWDLASVVPFNESYLSGFRAESYQIDLKKGFELGKERMDEAIAENVRKAIGGDEQRVHSISTRYDGLTFKHLLLPVWISAFRYAGKVYRFLINARTGEVQGERPWSVMKIALAVAGVVIAGVVLVMLSGK